MPSRLLGFGSFLQSRLTLVFQVWRILLTLALGSFLLCGEAGLHADGLGAIPDDFTLTGVSVGATTESQFGSGVALGDFDGDGYADLLVVAPLEKPYGRLFMFRGGPSGISSRPSWEFTSPMHRFCEPGMVVAVGDLNKDGYGDFVVSAKNPRNGEPSYYRLLVFHGSATGPAGAPDLILTDDEAESRFGNAVSGAGDVNGDGFADLIVGARDASSKPGHPEFGDGAAYLFLGSPKGLSRVPAWKHVGGAYAAHFGTSVSGGGDVNGDKFGDVLIGGDAISTDLDKAGGVWVFLGGKEGLGSEPTWKTFGESTTRTLGGTVLLGADPHGDGLSDVVVASHFGSRGQSGEGVVQMFKASRNGLAKTAEWAVEGNQPEIRFGFVLCRGDFNGDRRSDVVVATPYAQENGDCRGAVCVYYGSALGLSSRPDWSGLGHSPFDYFGAAVASGDINGDGSDDLVVGEHPYSHGTAKNGEIRIFYGGPKGLRSDSGWRPESERFGFDWRTVSLPFPNLAWRMAFVITLLVGGTWVAIISVKLRAARKGLVAETYARAQADERIRVARDLHDHLGGHLTRIVLGCERLQVQSKDATSGALQRIMHDAREAAQTVSEIVWATNPHHDRLDKLISFIADSAVRMFDTTGIRVELQLPPRIPATPVSSITRHHFFLASKEALNNVLKHSGANNVILKVNLLESKSLELVIRDDGKGRNPSSDRSLREGCGNGLTNMRARMEALGGVFELENLETRGVKVILRFPLLH